jgi:membrane protein CcdC involved in cytochrome C biogenesis
MKRSYQSVAILCGILLLNIVFTQFMVHQYFYENYANTLIFMGLNIVLFPIALFVYKNGRNKGGERT